MFGGDMIKKLQAMQQAVEESKKRLEGIKVSGYADDNKIKVEANGNREITDVIIEKDLNDYDKEELQDLVLLAVNRAIDQANTVNEQEMAQSAGQFMPGS